MAAATLHDVAERFGQFYVPRFEIRSGGSGISPQVVRDVISVTYNDSITEIDSVDIVVNNWDVDSRKFKYVGSESSARGDNDAGRNADGIGVGRREIHCYRIGGRGA